MNHKFIIPAAFLMLVAGPTLAATPEGQRAVTTPLRTEVLVRVAINWDQIAGNWKQFTGKARQQWGKLTDDDLEVAKGQRDELVGKIQERYGLTKEEASRQVDAWLKSLDP
jgi:uncharacterized protein YjbJ (UPF0337 family)